MKSDEEYIYNSESSSDSDTDSSEEIGPAKRRKLRHRSEPPKKTYEDSVGQELIDTLKTRPILLLYSESCNVNTDPYGVEEEIPEEEVKKKNETKKYKTIRKEIDNYNKKINISLVDQVIESNLSLHHKASIVHKLEHSSMCDSDRLKYITWVKNVMNLPLQKKKELPIKDINSPNNVNDFLVNVKNALNSVVYGHAHTKEEIIDYVSKIMEKGTSKGNVLALSGPAGVGKCLGFNTPVMMFDGSVKMVQDIMEGDKLMGDDSTARKVLSTARGRDQMYKITDLSTRESYIVNKAHILCLRTSAHAEPVEINVKVFMDYGNRNLKGYRTSIDFPARSVGLEPYTMGYWLGKEEEGSAIHDNNWFHALKNKFYGKSYECTTESLCEDCTVINAQIEHNIFMKDNLEFYNVFTNKNIPHYYKCNSRDKRLALLAGLIDGNNSRYKDEAFILINMNAVLAKGVVFLARSLGFVAYAQNYKKNPPFKQVVIKGAFINLPLRCSRNKFKKNSSDSLLYDFSIEDAGINNYYGFMLDGNSRFVLGDFTVTHNTRILRGLSKALQLPFHQISFGGLTDPTVLLGHSDTYIGSKFGKIAQIFVESKCENPIIYLDEIDKIADSYKATGMYGILTHMLDPEQNSEFADMYLDPVTLDLSKVLFVVSFNNLENIDPIVRNRLKIIEIEPPSIKEKIKILQEHILPELCRETNIDINKIVFTEEDMKYLILSKTDSEPGMRKIKQNAESIFQKINTLKYLKNCKDREQIDHDLIYKNMDIPLNDKGQIIISKAFIDKILRKRKREEHYGIYN